MPRADFTPPQIWGMKYTTAYSSLQNAIDTICPNTPTVSYPDGYLYDDGGVLFHPATEWTYDSGKLETHVIVPSNLTLVGADNIKSCLNWHGDTGTTSAIGLQVRKFLIDSGLYVANIKIRDLYLRGDWHTSKSCIETDESSFDADYTSHSGVYYKNGYDLEITGCTLNEWGRDGIVIEGTGPVGWWGKLRFQNNNHYANKRWAYYFHGDIRLLDLSNMYAGADLITISHDPETVSVQGGHGGIYGYGIWNANINGTCIESMNQNSEGDYSHSIIIPVGWNVQIFNHYEESNIYGLQAYWVRNLRVSEVYHMSNQGFYFGDCPGAIIENNHFVYTDDGIGESNVTMYLSGNLGGMTVRQNFHQYGTTPHGIKFNNITYEPDYVEQLYLEGTPAVGSSGRFIRGTKIPMQYKNGIPTDADFEYYEITSPEATYSKHNSIGIQCMDTSTGNVHIRTSAGWKTLSYTV